jgi:hypothetical protein
VLEQLTDQRGPSARSQIPEGMELRQPAHIIGWTPEPNSENQPSEGAKKSISSRQDAKTRKEQLLCFLCAFEDFAPLREMLLLFGGFFHTFSPLGRASGVSILLAEPSPRHPSPLPVI